MNKKNRIKELFGKGLNNVEIGEKLGLASNTISYHLKTMGLKQSTRVVDKSSFIDFYEAGYNDSQIAKKAKCNAETVRQWRLKNSLPTNFDYKDFRKFDYSKVKPLIQKGLKDSEIAKILGVHELSIWRVRTQILDIKRPSFSEGSPIHFTDKQMEFLVGCTMGDGTIFLRKTAKNPFFSCEHGFRQEEYAKSKYALFDKEQGFRLAKYQRNTVDLRTGIKYKSIRLVSPSTPSLHSLHKEFYPDNGKKIIPLNLLKDYYTPFALSIHYMDDGTKDLCGYTFATQGFSIVDVKNFTWFLKEKFDLNTTIRANKVVYIKAKSKNRFKNLVKPYIIPSMEYKL